MDFYKKTLFIFVIFIISIIIIIKALEPVAERQIKNIFKEKKLSSKLKKELTRSTEDFTPEKREFYKDIIKKLYIKWKPLLKESIKEAEIELKNN